MTTETNENQCGACIEDLDVKDPGEVRGGHIGVGELQETSISKDPCAAAATTGAPGGRLYLGTNVGVFVSVPSEK